MRARNHALAVLFLLLQACSLKSIDELTEGSTEDGDAEVQQDAATDDASSSRDAMTSAGGDGATRPSEAGPSEPRPGRDASAPPVDDAGTSTTLEDARAPTPPADTGTPTLPEDAATPSLPDATVSTPPDAGTVPVPPDWCPNRALGALCDDFEEGVLKPAMGERGDWSWLELSGDPGPSAASLVDDGPQHPGKRSFRSAVGRPGVEESARLMKSLPTVLVSMHVEFDLTVTLGAGTTNMLQLAKLQQRVDDRYPGLTLQMRDDGIFLQVVNIVDGARVASVEERISALPDETVRVRFDAAFGANGSISVAYDGVTKFERKGLRIGSPAAAETYFALGLYSIGGPASTALYDNVIIEGVD